MITVWAIWVVSGSGSYLKPLINTASDQANLDNFWYHATDKARLDYAEQWLSAYLEILPKKPQPILIYNGTPEQNEDLRKTVKQKKYKVSPAQIYFSPGNIVRTLDQVINFSFPPGLEMKGSYLGVLSHAPHLARILRFMNKKRKIFRGTRILALPLKLEDTEGEKKMVEMEIKGILDYIKKGQASPTPYPYKIRSAVSVSPIGPGDLMAIFKLSNQASVRTNSFNQKKIGLQEHQKWFKKKLADKNALMLKATVNQKLAGQFRLDIEHDQAVISVSVSEDFRGQGLGSALLQAAIMEAKAKRLRVIEALIKPDNLGSIKLFGKNGWVFDKKIKISNNKALRYRYKINEEKDGI